MSSEDLHIVFIQEQAGKMEISNIFDSIPENLDKDAFKLIIQDGDVKIERIISKGQVSPASGWYDQAQNEWVLVLKGEAILAFSGSEDVKLTPGCHINIPAHTKHKVKWTDPETETIWLAVHY